MTQPLQSPYNVPDLIQLLGQSTVELAFLRTQIARLEQRLKELEEEPPNGVIDVMPESETSHAKPG